MNYNTTIKITDNEQKMNKLAAMIYELANEFGNVDYFADLWYFIDDKKYRFPKGLNKHEFILHFVTENPNINKIQFTPTFEYKFEVCLTKKNYEIEISGEPKFINRCESVLNRLLFNFEPIDINKIKKISLDKIISENTSKLIYAFSISNIEENRFMDPVKIEFKKIHMIANEIYNAPGDIFKDGIIKTRKMAENSYINIENASLGEKVHTILSYNNDSFFEISIIKRELILYNLDSKYEDYICSKIEDIANMPCINLF